MKVPPPRPPPSPIRLLQALVAIAVVNTDFRRARAGEFVAAPPFSSGYEALADAEAPPAGVGGSGADAEEPEPRTWISLFWDTCLYVWPESFVLQVGRVGWGWGWGGAGGHVPVRVAR